ncbi:homeobox-domain-containing protein [Backusella circina FSU 941]|nr:homeobox-domain-containing protein [Backusella circina FSU 941]
MNSVTPTRKRTHLKASQVSILQESFNNNPLPDSSVRSRLARDLSVTERTIQIWFQNRRAKARKSEVFSNNSGSQTPRYQATFRTMMTPERFEELKQDHHQQIRRRPRSCSKPEPKSARLLESIMPNRAMSEGINHTIGIKKYSHLGQSKTPLQSVQLPVSVLRIGSWTRFAHASQQQQGLVCHANLAEREFIWKIQAEGHHFRIQLGFDHIQRLHLGQQIQLETGEWVGQIDIETQQAPLEFSMWRINQDQDWIRCGDFTEDKQASVDSIHILQGNHEAFKQVLLDLISLAPELATKISVAPVMTEADICRELTMSPSSTPEPTACIQPHQLVYPFAGQQEEKSMSHLMLQAPFFYPSVDGSDFYSMMGNTMYPSILM